MSSTMTVSEWALKELEPELVQALDKADVEVRTGDDTSCTSVNEWAGKYFSPEMRRAIPKITLNSECIDWQLETKRFYFGFSAGGKWLLVFTGLISFVLASLVLGYETVLAFVKAIWSA